MIGTKAEFRADGSCALVDEIDGEQISWPDVQRWAFDWFVESSGKQWGDAHWFIERACTDAVAGVVEALVVMAEVANDDPELLGAVGAGPLEDLVSHSGHGLEVLADVDRAARQNVTFRAALRSVWLGVDVPGPVRARLGELGARNLQRS